MRAKRKGTLGSLFLCLMLLSGCETGVPTDDRLLADMKEFALPDGSASLHLNEGWTSDDTGGEPFLMVGNESGTEVVFMYQFAKGGIYRVDGIDEVETLVDQTFQTSDKEETEIFEIPGMSQVSATRCKMTPDIVSGEAFVMYGETDYAFYAIGYIGDHWDERTEASFRASCSTFAESETVIEELDETTAEVTDTIRWFNASYAVLTEVNGWDYNRFGGLAANEETRQSAAEYLELWWEVTDRASAEETLNRILTEGDRTAYAENMAFLEEAGMGQARNRKSFLLENSRMPPQEAAAWANWYVPYEQYGENTLAGWDYCRALNLVGYSYLAGYYSENEALDKSLEIAQTVQPLFASWDDLIASYMLGYEISMWESSSSYQAVYEDLKSSEDSPYQVDFKIRLEKTW